MGIVGIVLLCGASAVGLYALAWLVVTCGRTIDMALAAGLALIVALYGMQAGAGRLGVSAATCWMVVVLMVVLGLLPRLARLWARRAATAPDRAA